MRMARFCMPVQTSCVLVLQANQRCLLQSSKQMYQADKAYGASMLQTTSSVYKPRLW